jgi:hypothetical protein
MSTTASSLTKFSVKTGETASAMTPPVLTPEQQIPAPSIKRRGTGSRVGVAVRLGHEDWVRLHDLAVRERSSLQGLIVDGLSELMRQRGLPPLSGR